MRLFKRIVSFFSLLFSFNACYAEYFQQEVKYTIHVTLNDKMHELSADETLIYKNNSGVILKEIYFQLSPAAFSNKNTVLANEIFQSGDDRMLSVNENDLGTIDSLDFKVNNEKVEWKILTDTVDVCKLILNKPLIPGESIVITTPFHVIIPSALISKLGHIGQSYFISDWYPKPAVYDENGWNYFPYLDKGGSFNEFGSFDVSITLPENYFIAASGIMIDGAEEYTRLSKADSITRKTNIFMEKDSTPPSSKIFKTLHFSKDNINDFAWFADKRWLLLKDSIVVNDRRIFTYTFFKNKELKYWIKLNEYLKDVFNYYSHLFFNFPDYQLSIVDIGHAYGRGTSYPMIAIDGNNDPVELELDVIRGVGQNWLNNIIGSNGRCNAWMNEGFNNFYMTRFIYEKYKNDSDKQQIVNRSSAINFIYINRKLNYRKFIFDSYLHGARMNVDQSPDLCLDKISLENYRPDVLYKTSISFDYLKSYLGDYFFDLCIKEYYSKWKYKHPKPDDLKSIFEVNSGKKLDWFFSDLLSSNKKLDYKISKINFTNQDSVELEIKNKGNINGPISISQIKDNKIISTKWIEGFTDKIKITLPQSNCDQYKLYALENSPDLYESNNSIKTSGILKKTEKIKLSFGINHENSSNTIISYSPVLGWNNYNKLMAGVVIHNISFNEKKFEYRFMPLYATGTKDIAGGGDVRYHFYPENKNINKITLRTGISRYAFAHDEYESPDNSFHYTNILHFTKFDTRMVVSLRPKEYKNNISREFTLRNILINRDIPYGYNYKEQNKNILYWQVDYTRRNPNPLINSLQKLNLTLSKNVLIVTGEISNFFTYGTSKKGFGMRIFGGYTSLTNGNNYGIDYRMSLSGRYGIDDYLFDEVFPGRTETDGILSHQFVNDYAGFKSPTSFYRLAETWMFGFNVNTTLPGIIPFRLFANTGTFDHSDENGKYGNISWELGIDLPLIKDIFIIYLPFAYSNDIKYAIEQQDFHTGDLIRFELHLNLLNPLEFIKNTTTEELIKKTTVE